MFDGFRSSFGGLTRCISEFLDRKLVSLVSGTIAVAILFLLFQLTWCGVLYDRGLRWYAPFLYPATFFMGLVMMWRGYVTAPPRRRHRMEGQARSVAPRS